MKNLKDKLIWILLLIVAFIGVDKLNNYWKHKELIATKPVLTDSEKFKAVNRDGKLTIITRNGEDQAVSVTSGSRLSSITVDKDGTVHTYVQIKGFIFGPGLCYGVDDDAPLLGLDFQWFYWQRFGVNCGLMIPHRHGTDLSNLRVHIAGSYVLPFKHVTNTSIFIGYNTRKSWVTGVRLKF